MKLENISSKPSEIALAKFSTKMIYLYNTINNFKNARDSHSFRIYNLSTLESAIENFNYYPINIEPENVIYGSYPNNRGIKWQRFIFDVPSCNSVMDDTVDYYYEKTEDRIYCITKEILKNEVNDLRTKCSWKVVCEGQAQWNEYFNDENFLLLLKIFKGDYKSILDSNSYFNVEYSGDVNLIYGLTGLSNSVTNSAPMSSTDYEFYVNNAGQYMESNKKSVAEIIKFLNGDSSTIQKLFNDFGDNEEVFSSFMKISATPSNVLPDADTLKFLINKIKGLTELESKTFAKIIELYSGNYYYLEDLVKTVNTKDRKLNQESSKAFGRFIYKLDSYTTGHYKVNMDSFNLTERSSYSLNPSQNIFSSFIDLFRIAMCQYPNKDNSFSDFIIDPVENDDYFGDKDSGARLEPNQQKNKEKKRNFEILFNIVNAILDQDFSPIFTYSLIEDSEDKKILKKVLKALNLLDGDSLDEEKIENDFQTLKVVCALKPNKIKSNESIKIPDCADQFKKANIIFLPDFVENKADIESKIASLVIGMQHWNIVEILKGLEGSQNKEVYTLFQSFYIWKNLGFLLNNWSTLEEKEKDKMQALSKLVGLSLKGFLGKALQTITISNQKKEKKKAKVKAEEPASESKEVEKINKDPLEKDANYKALVDMMTSSSSSVKLNHELLEVIKSVQPDDKENASNPHYLEWMLSLSKIYPGISDDPISKFEQFFTGRFIKRYIVNQKNNNILRYLFEFSMEAYKILYNRADVKKANADESNDPLQPIKILPSLVTFFPHLGKDDEKFQVLLKIFDLFIRLFVVLQKKQPKKGTNDEVTLASLGVFKIVFVSLKIPNEKLIFDLINVLTGYDLSQDSISPKPSDKRQVKLYEILEETLFQDKAIKKYINKNVLTSLDEILQNLLSVKVKSLTDQKFLSDVLKLLYVISGTEKKEELTKKAEKKEKKEKDNEEDIPERTALIELPMKEIECIFKLIQGDLTKIDVLIKAIDKDQQKVKMIQKAITNIQELGVFSGKGLPDLGSLLGGKKAAPDNEMSELMKKIQSGKASVHELFIAVDKEGDSSGSISKQEFDSVAKKLNINLTKHRINEIFASIKKGSGNPNEEELNEEEFGKAMKYLNNKNTFMALDFLGISKGMLIIALVGLIIILLMLFVFIFLGISAFAVGGGFGAVINSLMPMAAGAGVGGQKDEEKGKKVKDDNLGGAVAKTKTIIQSDKI